MPNDSSLKIYVFAENITEYFKLIRKLDEDIYTVLICKGMYQTNIFTLNNNPEDIDIVE